MQVSIPGPCGHRYDEEVPVNFMDHISSCPVCGEEHYLVSIDGHMEVERYDEIKRLVAECAELGREEAAKTDPVTLQWRDQFHARIWDIVRNAKHPGLN
jgi:hypothetical protein